MENKKVSVIIPVYNGERTIRQCIESVLNQSYKNFEILVINDGSTDKTEVILRRFEPNNKVIIFNHHNCGVSNARNIGIKNATGEYLSFVDADDYVENDFLQDLVDGMENDVDLSIIGLRHVYPRTPKKNKFDKYYEGKFTSSEVLNFLFSKYGPQGYLPNKLWRKQIILENNLFLDTTLNVLEDAVFTVKYLLNSRNVYIKNNKDYNYVHDGNTLTSGMSFTREQYKYNQTYQTMIKSAQQILNLVSQKENKKNEEAALVFLGMIYRDYVRHLLVYGNLSVNKKNYYRYRRIRKQLFKLKDVVLKNKYLDKKNYGIFVCTLYLPTLIKLIDNLRKND